MPIRGKIEKQCPLSVQIFGCVVLIQGQAMTTIFSKKTDPREFVSVSFSRF